MINPSEIQDMVDDMAKVIQDLAPLFREINGFSSSKYQYISDERKSNYKKLLEQMGKKFNVKIRVFYRGDLVKVGITGPRADAKILGKSVSLICQFESYLTMLSLFQKNSKSNVKIDSYINSLKNYKFII